MATISFKLKSPNGVLSDGVTAAPNKGMLPQSPSFFFADNVYVKYEDGGTVTVDLDDEDLHPLSIKTLAFYANSGYGIDIDSEDLDTLNEKVNEIDNPSVQ